MLGAEGSVFVFRVPGFGTFGQCRAQVKDLGPAEVMVILSENADSRDPLLPMLGLVATQFYKKNLRKYSPSQVTWVIHSKQLASGEETYQKITMSWDGERFCMPRPLARFNRGAFVDAFGEAFGVAS